MFVWFDVVGSITEILQHLFILLKFKSVVFVQTVQKPLSCSGKVFKTVSIVH